MKKYLSVSAIVLVLGCGAAAQNYNAGPLSINGALYDASAASGSTLATGSSLLVGSGGTWLLNDAKITTPRVSTAQTELAKFNGGTYTRSTGYINGYAAAENQPAGFVLPIGHSSYMPLTFNSPITLGSPVTAAWYDDQPLTTTHIDGILYYFQPGYYLLTTNAGLSVTVTVPAAAAGSHLLGSADGVNFLDLGPASASVTLPLGAYQLRFANSSAVLPLTLTAFIATRQNNTSLLTWKISSEQNVDYYTIERSADGRNFIAIGSQPSLGNTTQERTYILPDAEPLKGANYYRLKTTERNGLVSYSATQLLSFDPIVHIAVYPNPVMDKATITGLESGMQVTVINLQGQEITRQKASRSAMEISMKHLPAAMYQLQVHDATGKVVASDRIVKE